MFAKKISAVSKSVLLAVCTALLVMIGRAFALPAAALWGIALAGAMSLAGLISMEWAFRRSDKAFFTAFGVGFLSRIVLFGVFAWRVYAQHPASLVSAILALTFSYLLLLTLETYFLALPRPLLPS